MKILKSITLIIIFCFSSLFFLPKQSLYYKIEQELVKYDVILSEELIISSPFSLKIKGAILYIKGINIAKIDDINIAFNSVDISSKTIGYATAKIDIQKQSIIVNFEPTRKFIKEYKMVLKYFKKQNTTSSINEVYQYEYRFF